MSTYSIALAKLSLGLKFQWGVFVSLKENKFTLNQRVACDIKESVSALRGGRSLQEFIKVV